MSDYISGERIQDCAKVYLGLHSDPYDFQFNPYIAQQTHKLLDLSSINSQYDNPDIVFCYGHRVPLLMEKIQYFKNPFVLVTHNSDENIDSRYASLLLSGLIIRWYAQNVMLNHPKLRMLPIGIANRRWPHGDIDFLYSLKNRGLIKTNDIYFYFSIGTNYYERLACKEAIEQKGLVFGSSLHFSAYVQELSFHKFAICPPGNGVDCHRFWECYYLDVIPIALRSTFTEKLSKKLPCILLDSWNDLDVSTILPQYPTLLEMLHKNYKYLTMSYLIEQIESDLY